MDKKRKIIEVFCVFIILIAFVVIGYYTYQSYLSKKEQNNEEVKVDNYYNIDYLFNNDYLKNASTINEFNNSKESIYMYLDAENTLYIKYKNKNSTISIKGLSSGDLTIYYNNLYDNFYELVAKDEKAGIYYSSFNIDNSKDYTFTKVGENISEVYIPTYDKEKVFVNESSRLTTNFIFLDNDQNLKYLDFINNSYVLKNDLNQKKPYYDYICASSASEICSDIIIYQTFNGELVFGYNKDIKIKNEDNEVIIASDMFSVFEIESSKKIDLSNITKKQLKKYNYSFITYVIDKKSIMYKIEINKKIISNKEDVIATRVSESKVKQLDYEKNNDQITKVNILYENNQKNEIKKDNNKDIITSTIYDRNKDNNSSVVPVT